MWSRFGCPAVLSGTLEGLGHFQWANEYDEAYDAPGIPRITATQQKSVRRPTRSEGMEDLN